MTGERGAEVRRHGNRPDAGAGLRNSNGGLALAPDHCTLNADSHGLQIEILPAQLAHLYLKVWASSSFQVEPDRSHAKSATSSASGRGLRLSQRPVDIYLADYLDDVARTDLRFAGLSADPIRVAALQRALARNTATEASASKLSAEAEIPVPGTPTAEISAQTVRQYIDALTRIFVVEEQPAWAPHLRSKVRLRVQPKWHFVDPSLATAALRARPDALLDDLDAFGLLFQSLAVRDLRIYAQPLGGTVYHYRDDSGLEVDAIVELGDGRWSAFEVKLGGTGNIEKASASLRALKAKVSEQRARQLSTLNVVTAGAESFTRPDGVNVIALGHLFAG